MGEKNEILEAIAKLQINIQKDIASLREDVNKKYESMENNIKEIKAKQEENTSRIKELEKDQKRRNITIYGMPETEKNYFELESLILNLINNRLKVGCKVEEIDFVKRMGNKKEGNSRPIVVGLNTWGKKIRILKNGKELKDTNIFVSEDYPRDIMEIRKTLLPKMKEERKKGMHAIIKYDKLYVDGKLIEPETIADPLNKRKRPEKESPNSIQKASNSKVLKQKQQQPPKVKSNIFGRMRSGSTGNLAEEKSATNLATWLNTNSIHQ